MRVRENTWREDTQPEGDTEGLAKASSQSPALSDPWENTHDPHEVTVQLDATPDGSDCPVFVDESGRRSRRYRRIGISVGTACAIYAVVILGTLLSGNSHAPWLPVPGQGEAREAGRVENPPLPADPAEPTDAGIVPSDVSPPRSGGTTPSPGVSATAPGASASAEAPATSAAPKPTATKTDPATGSPTPAPTDPTTLPTSSPPDPPSTTTPSPAPTGSPTGGSAGPGTGIDTVADGANDTTPVNSGAQPVEFRPVESTL
jgi:hypothetical protein